jgi:hypothetical protein
MELGSHLTEATDPSLEGDRPVWSTPVLTIVPTSSTEVANAGLADNAVSS